MTVVVSTPYVNCLVEASFFKLISVVSNIGCKISGIAVGSYKNVVLELELVDIFLSLALSEEFFRFPRISFLEKYGS